MDFSTTLLREKFVIGDARGEQAPGHPITAMSNRMVVPLTDSTGHLSETFVVRGQTMHACIRMSAKIALTFSKTGPLINRAEKFDFREAWDEIVEDHELKFNPDRWIAVYHDGKLIFSAEEHHMFFDMVEKCDSKNPGNYAAAIRLAEDAFASLGKQVSITHDEDMGLVATVKDGYGKCGLILRNPHRRTTFNFIAENKAGSIVSIGQCLTVASAFLEGIQIAFQIGMVNEKLRQGLLERQGPENHRAESGRRRLGRLNAEIRTFENLLNVRYRPERPEFAQIITDAEAFTRDLFKNRDQ